MTGYGKVLSDTEEARISVEVKSLNSKFADVSVKIPRMFNDKELEIRNLISTELQRGKIVLMLDFQSKGENNPSVSIDRNLLSQYFNDLKGAGSELGITSDNELFRYALGMNGVMLNESKEEDNDKYWPLILKCIKETIVKIDGFRRDEGENLKSALQTYVNSIATNLDKVKTIDPERKEHVRNKLQDQLNTLKQEVNQDRFEQELIYYLEKLDIAEEIIRLTSHLEYITKELNGDGSGKKLGFIAQEMGREINTIGSKANFASMQQLVVQMKEDLEKIKEQVLNVL